MRNRINVIDPGAPMGYRERMAILRERKIEDTVDKKAYPLYADQDDHGSIVPPDGYSFEPYVNHLNGSWYGYDGWSKCFSKYMSTHPILIDPADAFPNRWMNRLLVLKLDLFGGDVGAKMNPDFSYDHLKPEQKLYGIVHGIGAEQHFGGDYHIGFELGWGGLIEKLEKYRADNPGHDEFYDAEILVIRGIQELMRRTVAAIGEAITAESHPALRENLIQMRESTSHLIDGAPQTLRQACEWICWFNFASRSYDGDGAGGQLDELLQPFYEADMEAGRLTREEALYYMACLLLHDTYYYQVSGENADGSDKTTYFSYMVLEAADMLDSSCNITIRVHKNIDRELVRKGVGYLFKNKSGWPRFSGGDALREGLMRKGYPAEIAVQRAAVGCNWMSLPGLEYTMNDCVKTNNAKIFRIALDEMMSENGEKSTERLWEIFCRHTRRCVEVTAEGIRFHLKHQARSMPELMLNLINHGPVERGLDITDGGAIYYNMCVDGTGLATVADSFAALQQRIEQEKLLTWESVYNALETNYEGQSGAYIRSVLASSNRYGGGGTRAEEWAERISKAFAADVDAMDSNGLKFIPGWFSWSNTIILGREVGATPNGRRNGEPINHGANPHPGFRRDGAVTAMSNAICIIQPGMGNTAPIQLEYDPGAALDDEAVNKFADYIITICRKGATLLNVNVINANRILEAHKNPAAFPDLVVRVTGFTAYFCLLTDEFRQLVVERILRASN